MCIRFVYGNFTHVCTMRPDTYGVFTVYTHPSRIYTHVRARVYMRASAHATRHEKQRIQCKHLVFTGVECLKTRKQTVNFPYTEV